MARSRFNFSAMLTDAVSLFHLGATIQPDGGMVIAANSPYAANVPCSFQPISGDKVLEFQQINIIATHVCLFQQGIAEVLVGDYFTNNGLTYDITYTEAEGGILNPIGVVFAIYGKLRNNR